MNNSTPHQTQMIDVGDKSETTREAVACGTISMTAETFAMVKTSTLPKGNALETARVAAILAAKNTPQIVPLCHPLLLTHIACEFAFDEETSTIRVQTRVRCVGKTGVEMEALTATSVALLTIYDMTKGVDETLQIGAISLLEKRGGKSGDWKNEPRNDTENHLTT